MRPRDARREALLDQVADYLLKSGLQGVSLRPLASTIGTSDRMLLYYFRDKDELLEAALGVLAERLLLLMQASRPSQPMPYNELLHGLAHQVRSPVFQPYMALWLELAAICARSDLRFQPVALQICKTFTDWIESTLQVHDEKLRGPLSVRLLMVLEGVLVLSSIGSIATVHEALAITGFEDPSPAFGAGRG